MNIDKYAVIHRQQLEKQIQSTEFQPLANQGILTYSYKYRYNLKKADQTKSRFCPDPLISKEYERVLYEKFNEY
ncbi:unnamed protein product [Paramecium primaurelia]|uniref:Uncharacterized protein n=1 Tax=Paramecium primaurelia TaxID=5886 RepID=A0A8S1ND47_PARPR|nr:unnamed protein product [Paramecium primaurelia]